MNLNKTPVMTMDTIREMHDMSWFTHAQVFDDLLIVSQKQTCCFVWKTSEGLVIIDAIWPDKAVYDAVISAIEAVGWNPDDIKKLVLTHGHLDHMGCGKWFVKNHGAKTYLSETDDKFWLEHPVEPDKPETFKDYEIDVYISDGDVIFCGDKSIFCLETPGHTPGCMSYIFPVTENGQEHVAAIFGGATPPRNDEAGTRQYLASAEYFKKTAEAKKADVMLFNHTVFDNGLERMAYSAKRTEYMPNCYVLSAGEFDKYCEIFRTLGEAALNK